MSEYDKQKAKEWDPYNGFENWDEEEQRKMQVFEGYCKRNNVTMERLLPMVAIHEAGHAITRIVHNIPLYCVALGWVEGATDHVSPGVYKDITCAGVAAEMLFYDEYTGGYFIDLSQFQHQSALQAALIGPNESPEETAKFFTYADGLVKFLEPFKEKLKELADMVLVSRVDGQRLKTWIANFNAWRTENGL